MTVTGPAKQLEAFKEAFKGYPNVLLANAIPFEDMNSVPYNQLQPKESFAALLPEPVESIKAFLREFMSEDSFFGSTKVFV